MTDISNLHDALQHIAQQRWNEEASVERLCDFAEHVLDDVRPRDELCSDVTREIHQFAVTRRFAPGDLEHLVKRALATERPVPKRSEVLVQADKIVAATKLVAEFEGIFGKLSATERRWLRRHISGEES